MWCCVHVVQVVSCTCDDVHTLCKWCDVHVVLCTCCTYGIGVCVGYFVHVIHVVFCTCGTMYVNCVVGVS